MADNLIQVGVQADISSLRSNMSAAASAVRSGSAEMKSSFDAATQAVDNYEQALKEVGVAAQQGNAQAIAIINQYKAAAHEAAAATMELAAAQRMQAGTEQAVTAATTSGISARQAATSSIKLLEGNMMASNRAAAGFLTTTLGLGPILQAAFPIIGAVALVGVLARIGEEAYKVIEASRDLASNIKKAFDELNQDSQTSNDKLTLTNDKLREAIGRLSGHPDNGIKRAIDEAVVAADELGKKLSEDLAKISEVASKNSNANLSGFMGRLVTGNASTGEADQQVKNSAASLAMVQEAQRKLVQQATESGDANAVKAAVKNQTEAVAKEADRQAAILAASLQNVIKMQQDYENRSQVGGLSLSKAQDQAPVIQTLTGVAQAYREVAAAQRLSAEGSDLKAQDDALEAKKQNAELAKRAAEEAKRAAAEAARAAMEAARQGAADTAAQYQGSAVAMHRYWEAVQSSAATGTALWIEAHIRMKAAAVDAHKQAAESAESEMKMTDEGSKTLAKMMDDNAKAIKKTSDEALKLADALQRVKDEGEQQRITGSFQGKEQNVQADQQDGLITKKQADQQLTVLYGQEEAALVAHLQKMRQIANAAATTAGAAGDKSEEDRQLQNMERINQQMLTAQQQFDQKMLQMQQRTAVQSMQVWQATFTSLNQGMSSAISGMIRGTQSFSQAMGRMFGNALTGLAQFVGQWLMKKAEMYVMDAIYAKVSQTTSAVSTIASQAAVASAASFASTAAIPIVGPAMAPAVAASSYAAVMAMAGLASAAGGWGQVPMDQIAMIHKNEMVLPAGLAEKVRNGAGGGGTTIHQNFGSNTYHGAKGPAQSDRQIAVSMKRAFRKGQFGR